MTVDQDDNEEKCISVSWWGECNISCWEIVDRKVAMWGQHGRLGWDWLTDSLSQNQPCSQEPENEASEVGHTTMCKALQLICMSMLHHRSTTNEFKALALLDQ